MKYTKKPVEIEAVQWDGYNHDEIFSFTEGKASFGGEKGDKISLFIDTLEGRMSAGVGDFIIKGIHGEFYPCKPDIFEATYSESDEINVGDLYEDCGYVPRLCVESDGFDVQGISLVNATEGGCSVTHCAPTKITVEEAIKLRQTWEQGERAVLIYKGWTEEAADKFMKDWR